jgi:hypothetical protein
MLIRTKPKLTKRQAGIITHLGLYARTDVEKARYDAVVAHELRRMNPVSDMRVVAAAIRAAKNRRK